MTHKFGRASQLADAKGAVGRGKVDEWWAVVAAEGHSSTELLQMEMKFATIAWRRG
jgi:hypothetical protein